MRGMTGGPHCPVSFVSSCCLCFRMSRIHQWSLWRNPRIFEEPCPWNDSPRSTASHRDSWSLEKMSMYEIRKVSSMLRCPFVPFLVAKRFGCALYFDQSGGHRRVGHRGKRTGKLVDVKHCSSRNMVAGRWGLMVQGRKCLRLTLLFRRIFLTSAFVGVGVG